MDSNSGFGTDHLSSQHTWAISTLGSLKRNGMRSKENQQIQSWSDDCSLNINEKGVGRMTVSYEERVLRWLRRELSASPPAGPSGKGILVEDIYLEKGRPKGEDIVILFREAQRPHCLFGFGMLAREPVEPEQQWKEEEDPEGRAPMGHGTVIYGNLMEQIQAADMGLPEAGDPDGITWI